MKQPMQVLTSSESNEWYTPSLIAAMAREVMGSIELDPASSHLANQLIGAERFFTKEMDGLERDWVCETLFTNPPYGKTGNRSNQEIWARYLLSQYRAGNVKQAICLTKTVPGYDWWDWMFAEWPVVCITMGRIAFVRPEWIELDHYSGELEYPQPPKINWPPGDNRSKAASSFWYLGEREEKFAEVFSRLGRVIQQEHD